MLSMTGYGKAHKTFQLFDITIEVKSVNNRYIDIMFKSPVIISHFESKLRETVKKNVSRGKVSVFIEIKETDDNTSEEVINEKKLQHYYGMLQEIKTKLKLEDPIELHHLLQFQELFEVDISAVDQKKFLRVLDGTLKDALKAFNKMRLKEGKHLLNDMQKRINKITKIIEEIVNTAPLNVKQEYKKLSERINELLQNQKVDDDRLAQEIALLSDKVDISEELTRMQSHLKQFEQAMKSDKELGKKLTFILQEMHREANTMNSKTTDVDIAHQVIIVKEEIEKIREQAQNLE